jgi:release factor glutamine methyltransferase
MLTVLEVIKRTTDFLAAKGVESPRLNAELLLGHALGRKRMALYLEFERPLTESELAAIRPLVRRRGQREPLQYILGEVEFAGVKLKVDRRALIPRPETELLVELVLEWLARRPPVERILDLGTGTGAIALALARALPTTGVVALDASPEALALAAENVERNDLQARVTLLASDWFQSVAPGTFGAIVSNPPYLTEVELQTAAPEVRDFEPQRALAAADDGLRDLEVLIRTAPQYLVRGGLLALETGVGQRDRLGALLKAAGYSQVEFRDDLAGRDRFILAAW